MNGSTPANLIFISLWVLLAIGFPAGLWLDRRVSSLDYKGAAT